MFFKNHTAFPKSIHSPTLINCYFIFLLSSNFENFLLPLLYSPERKWKIENSHHPCHVWTQLHTMELFLFAHVLTSINSSTCPLDPIPTHLLKDITLQFMPLFPVSPIFYFLLYHCHKHLRNTVISLICKMRDLILCLPLAPAPLIFILYFIAKHLLSRNCPYCHSLLSPLQSGFCHHCSTKSSFRIINGLLIDKSNVQFSVPTLFGLLAVMAIVDHSLFLGFQDLTLL